MRTTNFGLTVIDTWLNRFVSLGFIEPEENQTVKTAKWFYINTALISDTLPTQESKPNAKPTNSD
jgi:hypothetical protein